MKSFSGLVGPQNPLITLLKKKRESKSKSTPVHLTEELPPDKSEQFRIEPVIETKNKTIYVKFNRSQTNTTDFKPMSIHQYEPGQSSIVKSEDLHEPKEYNPPICKPGDLCNYSGNSDSKGFNFKKRSEQQVNYTIQKNVRYTNEEQSDGINYANEERSTNMYKDIMRGGDIPKEGLKSYVEIRKAKTLPNTSSKNSLGSLSTIEETLNQAVSDLQLSTSLLSSINDSSSFDSSGCSKPSMARIEKEMEILARRNEVERVVDLERRRGKEREMKRNAERRHNDFLLPTDKSPVRLNRYENGNEVQFKSNEKCSSFGIGMYNFTAKSNRELTMSKGDRVRIIRRVDRNWWEVEKAGDVGIVPVTYVKLVKEIGNLPQLPSSSHLKRRHLQGKVLFNFETNYPSELPVKKGERLSILRQLDADWVEVRSRNGEGAVPSSYIQPIINDYDDDVMGSASSRTITPIFDAQERLETVSPIESVYSVLSHAPTIPSAPRSPVGSQHSTNLSTDWPTLETSLANLQHNISNSNIQEVDYGRYTPQQQLQQQHQQHQHEQQQQQDKKDLLERYNSILRKQRQHQTPSPAIRKQKQLQQPQQTFSPVTRIQNGSVIQVDNVNNNKVYNKHSKSNISSTNNVRDSTIKNNVTIKTINNNNSYNTNTKTDFKYNPSNATNYKNNYINNTMTRSCTSEFSNHSPSIFTSPERFIDQHHSINNIENKGYFESKASVLSNSQYNSNISNNSIHYNFKKPNDNRNVNPLSDNRFNTIQNIKINNHPNQRYMSNIEKMNNLESNGYNSQENYNPNNRNTYSSTSSITEKEVVTLKPIKLQAVLPPDYSRIYSNQYSSHNTPTPMNRNLLRGSMILNKTPLTNLYTINTANNNRAHLNRSFNSGYNTPIISENKYADSNNNDTSSSHNNSTFNLTANKRHSNVVIMSSDRLMNSKNQSNFSSPHQKHHHLTNGSLSRFKNNYRVLNQYTPRKSDELMLRHGDVIKVMEKCSDGWWVGASIETGDMGIFPGNHVIPL